MDKAIAWLQEMHPWLSYAQGFALITDSFRRHAPQDRYCGMAKTLVNMDVGIFGRETENQVRNRLAIIEEWI